MEEQQVCYITSIAVLQPTLHNRNISHVTDTTTQAKYLLKVDASHGNTILVQTGAGNCSVNHFDVSRIVYDPTAQPFYWHNVRPFIEATLIGYHGMIIFLQSSHIQLDKISISPIQILYKAVDQIFYCISHSKCKHTQLFQILFSHYALSIEGGHVFDLCRGLDPAAHLFRYVQGRQQKLIKTRVSSLDDFKQLISRNYNNFLSELPQGSAETRNLAKLGYHEFMFINVGFTGFSASFAPIGGELTFVTLSTDYLSASNTDTNTGTLDVRSISLLTAKTLDPLKRLLDNFDSENVSDQTPLCTMLRDGIGGPCKTCVVTVVPDNFLLSENENKSANEICHLLGIAKKFARVKNCPNRRVFAEKALMNIYMQEIDAQSESYALDYPPEDEDTGEDSVQQAAIALQDAVLEYNKRLQSADGEGLGILDVNETDEQSKENTNEFVEEKVFTDMLPNKPISGYQRTVHRTVIAENISKVEKTASPDLQVVNEVTRITDDNTENSIPNSKTTPTHNHVSPYHRKYTDSGNSFVNSVTDNRTVGDNCRIASDVPEDLLYERMDLHSSKRNATFDGTGINSEPVMQLRIKGILQLDDRTQLSTTRSDKDEVSNGNESADHLLRFNDSHDAKIAEVVSFMLQDPHKGAPRCFEARGNNEILQRRDLGSVFTGEVITTWIKENIDGMNDFDNAEMFGQWLLDQGVLIHSEGSGVFAAAESLFYYAKRSQPSTGKLSLEEIRRIMLEANKVLQPANTEFYDPTGEELNHHTENNIVDDDMIYHQLMAEQHIVIQTADSHARMNDNSLTGKQMNAASNESSPNSLTVSVNRSSNVKKFSWNPNESLNTELEDGTAPNKISEMFQTRSVVVTQESSECKEKVITVKKDVLVGNLTEKYVENIIQVYQLHPLFENSRNGCRMGVLKNLVLTFGVNFEDEQKRTAIFYAAAGDQGRIGLELIHSHANVNHTDNCKLTPLLVASQLGHVSFMTMLLNNGADVTMSDNSGSNAYHLACKLEATGCLVKLMKKAKSDVLNTLDNSGVTPLHYAIKNKFPVHLEMLLKYNIDKSILDPRGLSYLSYAVFYQSISCVNQLLKRYPMLLGEGNVDNSTPLHVAAMQQTADSIEVLLMNAKNLKKHFDIHQCDNKDRSVLHAACMRGCDESVRLLLQSNFSVLVVDSAGANPLKYAQGNSKLSQDVIELLEAAEIDQVRGIVKLQETGSKSCQIQ